MFLTTKMWPRDYGYESALQAAKVSLAKLDTDYFGKSSLPTLGFNFKQHRIKLESDRCYENIIRSLHASLAHLPQLGERHPANARRNVARDGITTG
jgi:hypothetical protein